MELTNGNIAILTTVGNFELYSKTSGFFPEGIPVYVIDGRNGMHGLHSILYMFKKLKKLGVAWLIMADEDVIFNNPNKVFDLIRYMSRNNYTICGVRDGGVIKHRNFNPYAINTFFSILNFEKVSKLFDEREILANQYVKEYEFDDDLDSLKFGYDMTSLYEPYYCFYFWLRRKGEQILFLNSETMKEEEEKISNKVYGTNGELLLVHTWYARSYKKNLKHTTRIDCILRASGPKPKPRQFIILKDRSFWLKSKILRTARLIKRSLALL